MKTKTVIPAIVALMGLAALAADNQTVVLWNVPAVNGSTSWGVPENWTDVDGKPLTVAPTNAADRFAVRLPAPLSSTGKDTFSTRVLDTGGLAGSDSKSSLAAGSVNPSIYSIGADDETTTYRYAVTHTIRNSGDRYGIAREFTIVNPNAFKGLWKTEDALASFVLPATTDFTPVLSALDTKVRPTVKVPTAGTTAEIDNVRGGGLLVKTGAGSLRVNTTSGDNDGFRIEDGDLELRGSGDDGVEALIAKAALHLDASADTLVKSNAIDRTWIRRWDDPKSGNYALASSYANTSPRYSFSLPAFLSPVLSPTGLPLVDFGAHSPEQVAELGPTNCFLQLKNRLTNVREIFFVAQPSKGLCGTTIIGDTSGYFYTSDGWTLFAETTAASKGLVHVNGSRMQMSEANASAFTKSCTNLTVFSVAAVGDTSVGLLGSDRYLMNKSGGSRLGEVVAFTNALTQAERTALNRFLVKKWIRGEEWLDASAVTLCKPTAKLVVPSGRTARVGRLVTTGTFVKAGGGRLEIAEIHPANTKITVEGGSVGLGEAEVGTDGPADGAYIWLDANADSFTSAGDAGDGLEHVTEWRDCRVAVNRTATAIGCQAGVTPTLVSDAVGTNRVVDLGLGGSTEYGTQSFFALPTWKSGAEADTYAGFIVYRRTSTNVQWPIFASDTMSMTLESSVGCLLSSRYVATTPPAARWTIDGVAVNPWEQQPAMNQTAEFSVVAFKSATPLVVNAMSKDRFAATLARRCGNCQIGEFITYHYPLTEDEFRKTEAYLLRKWLDKGHPAEGNSLALDVDSGVPAEVVAGRDTVVTSLAGGNGTLVKSGAATADVATTHPAISSGIAVADGKLSLAIDVSSRAVLHLDASDLSSFTWQETPGDGQTVVTNVTYWYDVRRNGRYARSAFDWGYGLNVAKANPVRRAVETAPGVIRPVVDFGPMKRTNKDPEVTDSSAMIFNEKIDTCREVVIVHADRTGNHNSILGGGTTTTAYNDGRAWDVNDGNFMREESINLLNGSYAYRGFRDGDAFVRMDGEKVVPTATKHEGFHVLAFVPGADTASNGVVRVGSLAYDRACKAGGAYVAEVLVFDQVLSDGEREALENHLLKKWMNAEAPTTPVLATSKLELGDGSSLDFAAGGLSTSSLVANGSAGVSCETLELDEDAYLSCRLLSQTALSSLSVNGSVVLPETLTIVMNPGTAGRLRRGEYVLLTASGGITGSPHFVIDDSALEKPLNCPKVAVRGNQLVLTLGGGLVIFVR